MKRFTAPGTFLVALAAFGATLSLPAGAGHVVLRQKAGDFKFEGDLKPFDGIDFVIETPTGSIALPANDFICTGSDCPKLALRAVAASAIPSVPPPVRFTMFGATSIGDDLIPALIRAFGTSRGERTEEVFRTQSSKTHFTLYKNREAPTIELDMQRDGTAHGLKALAKGDVNIAMAGRAITPDEIKLLPPAKAGQTARYDATVVALDGVAVLISPKRKLDALTPVQLGGIFSGRITDWAELGLEPGSIRVYAPDVGNGTLDIFLATILKPQALVLSPFATRMNDFVKMSDVVAADANAIAIASTAFQRDAKAVSIQDACGIVTPLSPFTVKSEEYPMSHRAYLYTTGPVQPVVADFIRFTQAAEAQTTVVDKQFVNQTIVPGGLGRDTHRVSTLPEPGLSAPEQALRLRLATDLSAARRLSVTLRFASGTSLLDERARYDVNRLAAWLKAPQNARATAILAGFTDQLGGLPGNVALSQKRAEQARQAVLAAGGGIRPERIEVRGYGPIAPVACNTDPQRQNLNRRVEVWFKN